MASRNFLGALAAWTRRVPLVMTVVVPQLHDPVMLAKSLATGDMLSGGRLTVALGVGGRHEDYRAVGADPSTQTMRQLADRAETLKVVSEQLKAPDPVLETYLLKENDFARDPGAAPSLV